MKATYTAVVKEDAGWWIGWVEELPGVSPTPSVCLVWPSLPPVYNLRDLIDDSTESSFITQVSIEAILGPKDSTLMLYVGLISWHLGDREKTETIREKMVSAYMESDGATMSAAYIGHLTLALDRIDDGDDWLERGYRNREWWILMTPLTVRDAPTIDDNPRFQAFLAKMSLDDASIAVLEAAE